MTTDRNPSRMILHLKAPSRLSS